MSSQNESESTDIPSGQVKTEPSPVASTVANVPPKPDNVTSKLNFSPDAAIKQDKDTVDIQVQDTKGGSQPMQIRLVSQIITD